MKNQENFKEIEQTFLTGAIFARLSFQRSMLGILGQVLPSGKLQHDHGLRRLSATTT
ncbi:MAG: hypothetical protein ACTHMI_02090 [Mucilaginibacter sp.]